MSGSEYEQQGNGNGRTTTPTREGIAPCRPASYAGCERAWGFCGFPFHPILPIFFFRPGREGAEGAFFFFTPVKLFPREGAKSSRNILGQKVLQSAATAVRSNHDSSSRPYRGTPHHDNKPYRGTPHHNCSSKPYRGTPHHKRSNEPYRGTPHSNFLVAAHIKIKK